MSRPLLVVGVLSGTSVDGISVVAADISHSDGAYAVKQRAFNTFPWLDNERQLIFRLFKERNLSSADLCEANFLLGKAFSRAVHQLLESSAIDRKEVDLIGSHGQTIWHNVDESGKVTSTLQIGEAAVIAEETGITTVADFRVADVAAGGQGAPLTSTFDQLVLAPPATANGWRALQNIGGIGNVTLLPPRGATGLTSVAFDTGPGNVLLDWLIYKVTNGECKYDKDGEFGRKGKVNDTLLSEIMKHPYFSKPPPKTTGRELFSAEYAELLDVKRSELGISDEDFMATLVEVTAQSIARSYSTYDVSEVLVSGGGGRNTFLLERLAQALTKIFPNRKVSVSTHESIGIDSDAKEALLFALLAYLCVKGIRGSIPSCTFAKDSRVLGKIVPGANFHSVVLNSV